VRWRDDQGQAHSRVIGRKADAIAFDVELKRAKRRGNVVPINDDSGETVEQFAKTWWSRYVVPSLSRHTQLAYASMLDVHIIPNVGEQPLKAVNAETIWQLRADMTEAGVGDAAIRKTLIAVRAYAGLRPGEALGLRWRHPPQHHPGRALRRLREAQDHQDREDALRQAGQAFGQHACDVEARHVARPAHRPRLSLPRRLSLEPGPRQ
jgi:hypothetical protein